MNIDTLPGSPGDCIALTEPGALWLPGHLDVALGCVYLDGGTPRIRVDLVRSADHGASWAWVSTLLAATDAACGSTVPGINGADLFVANDREYVVASMSASNGLYDGCLTFEVDPESGEVARDGVGHAIATRAIIGPAGTLTGGCAFTPATGYYVDLLEPGPVFHVIAPGLTAP